MKAKEADWYRHVWTLEIKGQSWVEETEEQVEFLIRTLALTGRERILDLACGYGRHALAFARRGFRVVGVDLTEAYIRDAEEEAARQGLSPTFVRADLRELDYREEFDLVLNLADGAIGYLEDDWENEKIFDAIARALVPGGKHFLDICSAEHAERHFPKRHWEAGTHALSLAEFDWDPSSRRMLFCGWEIPYGGVAVPPEEREGDPIRLYTRKELEELMDRRDMSVIATFSNYRGAPATARELQLLVYSQKRGGKQNIGKQL